MSFSNPVHTGRPEDYPVNKPAGGLSVGIELLANGTGMRSMPFIYDITILGFKSTRTKKRKGDVVIWDQGTASTSASSTAKPPQNIEQAKIEPAVRNQTTEDGAPKENRRERRARMRRLEQEAAAAAAAASPITEQECDGSPAAKRPRLPSVLQQANGPDTDTKQEKKTPLDTETSKENDTICNTEPHVNDDVTQNDDKESQGDTKKPKYGTVSGPEKDNKNKPVFTYGNYETYYGGRMEDTRWLAMQKLMGPYVANKDVLDIGCNTGKITAAVARSQHWPRSVLGVDIDELLIEKANARNNLPNLTFVAENWLQKEKVEGEEYDAILCLSVAKWIHFQFGDHGIRRFFRKIYRKLRDGGIFVLESQDMKSYKKKRHLTPHIRENVRTMQLFPDDFPQFLESLGFQLIETIAPEKATPGFDRPLQFFVKSPTTVSEEKKEEDKAEDL